MRSSEVLNATRAPVVRWILRIAAGCARALVSIAVALLVAEIGLRMAGVKFTSSFYSNDPVTGWVLRPNAEGWSVDERSIYVHINSAGLHDREHTLAKPPGVLRIAVLGDSMTASVEVAPQDTSSAVMERSLAHCAAAQPRRVEVLNFGVPGFNTAQMLLLLRSRVWSYSPDIVLFEFFSGNSVLNNRRDLTNADASLAPFYLLRNGTLELDEAFRSQPSEQPGAIRRHNRTADVMNRVRLLQLANETRISLKQRLARRQPGGDSRLAKYGPEYQWRLPYTPPSDPEIENAWQITEALLLAIRDEVRAHGAQFWIAVFTPEPRHSAMAEARYGGRHPEGLVYPEWRVAALARRESIPIVLMTAYMKEYADRHHVYLNGWPGGNPGVGHWNELGQRVAGEFLAAKFCSMLGPDPTH